MDKRSVLQELGPGWSQVEPSSSTTAQLTWVHDNGSKVVGTYSEAKGKVMYQFFDAQGRALGAEFSRDSLEATIRALMRL